MPSEQDGAAYHEGEPVSDYETKTALLVAGLKDTVAVEGHGEMTVVKRNDCYLGPKLTLVDDNEQNWRVVPAGFAADPELWKAVSDDDGFIEGWERVGNVSLEVVDVGKATQCKCGEILQNRREKSMALVAGVCPHE
ncbi:hypothetical protein [Haloarcula amylovorans]|uniref:hypothetical protein n=1 Tax=Haloarcula amylovorans TaxID=2562280 RepID=UPI001075DB0C|nr:hypothetical protein [Halomicroarcula amylolytica]